MLGFKNKLLCYIMVGLGLLASLFLYGEISAMGFPDGHLTKLERARRPLFIAGSILGVLFGIFFLYLARFSKFENGKKPLKYGIVLFILALMTLASLSWFFAMYLDHGTGG